MVYCLSGAYFFSLALVLFGDFLAPPGMWAYDSQRFMLAVLLGVLSVLSLTKCILNELPNARFLAKLVLPTTLLCSAFLLSSLPFQRGDYAWVESGMFALFFLTINVAALALKGTGETALYVRFFIVSMVSACTIYGLSCINIYVFALVDRNPDFGRYIPYGFANIRYWSHIATWCLPLFPLAVLIGPLKDKRFWRIFVLTGAAIWWWVLIQSMGRGSLLGIAVGGFLVLSLFGKRALPWFKILIFHLGAGILLWLLLSLIIPSVLYDGESQLRSFHTGASGRMPLFIEAWQMSLQNFPLGMGAQSWIIEKPLTEIYALSVKFGHPHNMYLFWAAEYGWILIMFLGLLVLQAIRYFWSIRSFFLSRPKNRASDEELLLLVAFTASVSAALFHGGVSAVFLAPGSMLVGLFVLIVFWALIVPGAAEQQELPQLREQKKFNSKNAIALFLPAALCIGWLVWMNGVCNYYENMQADRKTYSEAVAKATFPRFWRHGNFPR